MRPPITSATPFLPEMRAALSITFDDSRRSHLELAVPILERHGLRGTFYVLPTPVRERVDEWRRVAATHEIGNHSEAHPVPAGRYGPGDRALDMYTTARMKDELVRADDTIQALLGVRPETFAYPGGFTHVGEGAHTASYVPIVARRYVAGRGYRSEFANDPAWCDFARLDAAHVDGYDGAELVALVDAAIEDRRWLIVVAHEIDGDGPWSLSSRALDALCREAAQRPDLWVAPVVDVARHLRAQRPRRTGATLRRHYLSARARVAPLKRKLVRKGDRRSTQRLRGGDE
jgi:peptidoglycan/xylan/chitin deacetylase (PgdA/CDA1 family)